MPFDHLPFLKLLDVTTMTLATTPGDLPHVAPVYFAAGRQLQLYFFSDKNSLHSQHIEQQSQAAAAIYPVCDDWRDIQGLQLNGVVGLVESSAEWDSAWDLYQQKFPFVRALRFIVAQNQLYVFTPNWIRLVDNSKGFGYKQEFKVTGLTIKVISESKAGEFPQQ